MMAGFAVGMVRMGLEFGYKVPPCGSGRIVRYLFNKILCESEFIKFNFRISC